MFKAFRSSAAGAFVLCLVAIFSTLAATAQTSPLQMALDKQLARVQLAVTGVPLITSTVTGTNYLGTNITQKASNTTGVIVTLNYTISRYVGFEGNFGYARYTENYTCLPTNINCTLSNPAIPCVPPATVCPAYVVGGAQVSPREYTLGYIIHPAKIFNFDPYVSVGAGTTAFIPTRYGGQNLPEQARATYYYSLGVERSVFSPHFGLRAQMRETFFKAPDLLENYLTINKHTTTFEPGVGFYLKF